jgi:hypothetical protein
MNLLEGHALWSQVAIFHRALVPYKAYIVAWTKAHFLMHGFMPRQNQDTKVLCISEVDEVIKIQKARMKNNRNTLCAFVLTSPKCDQSMTAKLLLSLLLLPVLDTW